MCLAGEHQEAVLQSWTDALKLKTKLLFLNINNNKLTSIYLIVWAPVDDIFLTGKFTRTGWWNIVTSLVRMSRCRYFINSFWLNFVYFHIQGLHLRICFFIVFFAQAVYGVFTLTFTLSLWLVHVCFCSCCRLRLHLSLHFGGSFCIHSHSCFGLCWCEITKF